MTEHAESEAGQPLDGLLGRLEAALAELERSEDSEDAVERLTAMAELAREVQAEIERLRDEVRSGGDASA